MKNLGIKSLIVATMLAGYACTNDNNKGKADTAEIAEDTNEARFDDTKLEDDSEFMVTAASGGLMEVKLGELAKTNAMSESVKDFAKQMVSDHTKANEKLTALAASKNISIPLAPSDKHQKHIDDISSKTGKDFDKAYMDLMVEDHEEDIDLFEKQAENGKDADIKSFASTTLATLKHHLEMAKGVKDKLK